MFDFSSGECEYGDNCGLHFRKSQLLVEDGDFLAVDYIGEYCVITQLTSDAEVAISMLLGKDVVDARTFVVRVGDGAVVNLGSSDMLQAMVFRAWDIIYPASMSLTEALEDPDGFDRAYADMLTTSHMENIERAKSELNI